jgi:hypothetical protein
MKKGNAAFRHKASGCDIGIGVTVVKTEPVEGPSGSIS